MTDRNALMELAGKWVTLECDSAHYVARGKNVILCDRLPSPVTLVVKLCARASLEVD